MGAFSVIVKLLREPSFEAQITTLLLCLGSGGWEQQQQPNDRMPFLLSSSWLWCGSVLAGAGRMHITLDAGSRGQRVTLSRHHDWVRWAS